MKNLLLILTGTTLALAADSLNAAVRWDGVFLETKFSNFVGVLQAGETRQTNAAVAFPNGGNVTNYPGPLGGVIPSDVTRTIQLRQSTIGHVFAPISPMPLVEKGRQLLASAVAYNPPVTEVSEHSRGDGQPWNIRFAGVVDPQIIGSMDPCVSTFQDSLATPFNFLPDLLVNESDSAASETNSAAFYRAALRLDPLNTTAAHGLLRTYYERMAAFTYAGHNANQRAVRVRLVLGSMDCEITMLEDYALPFYKRATDELNLLTSRALEAQLFDGSYPHIPAAELAGNRNLLTEAYTRALTHQAETVFRMGRLKQFKTYRNPWIDPSAAQDVSGLLNELSGHRRSTAERQLLLELASELTPVARAERGRANYLIAQIQRLESAIENGRIAFIAAHDTGSGTPAQPDIKYVFREYAPDYVPFHALTSVGGVPKRAHEQFLGTASEFMVRAATKETEANAVTWNFDLSQSAHADSLRDIRTRYFHELKLLCGSIRSNGDGTGELVPDVLFALYPRDQRLTNHVYAFASGEDLGEIGAQWGRIDQAEAELQIAYSDLEAIYSQMEKKIEVAGKITEGIENLARMFLENGEILEKLDLKAGKLQAEAAMARAKAAQSSGWLSGFKSALGVAASIGVAYFTGGGSFVAENAWGAVLGGGGQALLGAWQTSESNGNNKEIGNIEAKLALKLAEINAQRTHIATLEKVAVQFQQRDQFLLQTEEALHSLFLQAERQKLTILLAEQRVGSELVALQNLIGRVHYLLQEYASAIALQSRNPLTSPDYRLVRDITLREAEDAFHLAHRWVYLAAKSVEYRVNSPDESGLQGTIATILRARNASSLNNATAGLNDTLGSFYHLQAREVSGLTPNPISFRHHLIQRNTLTNEQDIVSAELQPAGLTSAEHWLKFLLDHTVTNALGRRERLVIPFSTTLDRWPDTDDSGFKNPLFSKQTHNDAISGKGIEVQFLGIGLSLSGRIPRFEIEYLGASAMRQESCAPTGGKRVRYWNIRLPDGSPYGADGIPGVGASGNWGMGATGLNEFSPANDRWHLVIDGTQGGGAAGNAEILRQLEQVTDIRIQFWTDYFKKIPECP